MTTQVGVQETPVSEHGFQQTQYTGYGSISQIGVFLLLLGIVIASGFSLTHLVNEMFALFVVGPSSVDGLGNPGILAITMNVVAVMLLTAFGMVLFGAVLKNVIGGGKSFHANAIEKLLDNGPAKLFFTVLVEEVITRGFVMGLLLSLFGRTHLAFIVLFLIGNGIFALVHLANYKDKADRSVLRVIPQFVAGAAMTYIFMRWGLGVAILAHFYYDVLLLAGLKEQKPNKTSLILLGYYMIITVFCLGVMASSGISLSDLNPWLMAEGTLLPLAGYTIGGYIVLLLFIDVIATVIAEVLLFDSPPIVSDLSPVRDAFRIVIGVLILFGLNLLLSLFIQEPITRAIVITIVLAMATPTYSGSSLARVMIMDIPGVFLSIAAYTALGIGPALVISTIFYLAHYIPRYIQLRSNA